MKFKYKGFQEFDVDGVHPLFVAVSGAHAYGTVRADSDLDIRAVRIPDIAWATSLARDEHGVEHKFGNVDVSIHNVYHFTSVLLHGNAAFLEILWQETLYTSPEFIGFRNLIMRYGLTKRFGGHFYGFIDSSIKDYAKRKQIKKLLYGYRIAMSGIHFYTTGEVKCNINELMDLRPKWNDAINKWTFIEGIKEDICSRVVALLDHYKTEGDIILPDNPLAVKSVEELRLLTYIFGRYGRTGFEFSPLVRDSQFPEEPKYEPFNKWLRELLLSDWEHVKDYPLLAKEGAFDR